MATLIDSQPADVRANVFPDERDWHYEFTEGGRPATPVQLERDRRLARIAERYLATLGQSGQAETLGDEFGYEPGTVTQMIREARQRRLLTQTRRGVAGGQLTPRALGLLGKVPPEQLATPEQKLAKMKRDRRAQRLSERHEAGEIDRETYIRLANELAGTD